MFIASNITKVANICLNDQLNIMYQHKNNILPKAISNIITEAESNLRPERQKANKINIKTYANTGIIAYDMLENWKKLDDPIKTKKFSPITVKRRIKSYLQLNSENLCKKSECHACEITPNIKKLFAHKYYT